MTCGTLEIVKVVLLIALVAILLGWDRKTVKKSIDYLYEWKDKTVDPHIVKTPIEYVRAPYCNRNHDEIRDTYEKRHAELMSEMISIRSILVKHLINGTAQE